MSDCDSTTKKRSENSTTDNNSHELIFIGTRKQRTQSDLRSAAILCHNQISKELWGKKHANSFVDHLRPPEVEAFALDIALRSYWELHKLKDELSPGSLSVNATAHLRQLALGVLRKYQEELTQIYSFEIPDPRAVREREEKKQQQLEASKAQRKQRAEAAKKEREERAARMKAQRLAAAKEKEEKERKLLLEEQEHQNEEKNDSINSDNSTTTTTSSSVNDEKIVQKSLISGGNSSISISKPASSTISAPTITTNSTKIQKNSSIKISTSTIQISSPNDKTKLSSTSDSSKKSISISDFSKDKKSITIQPPPSRRNLGSISSTPKSNSIAAFAASRKEQKSFKIQPPPKKKDQTSASTPTIITPSTTITTKKSIDTSKISLIQSSTAPAKKKKEKTFARPSKLTRSGSEEEPIPNITLKQTLVNTEKLVPLIQEAVNDQFSYLQELSQEENFLEFYHWTEKGPRPANEDEYTIVEHVNEYVGLDKDSDRFSFFGAYDGHCGKYTSLFIRSQIHHKVCKHPKFPNDIDKAIHESILEIDRLANDIQERDEFACGSTALAVWVRNNEELIVGNVGDCRGFICRGGKPIEIANPHHPNREDEKQRIESGGGAVIKRGAWRVNGILAVSRSIGDNNLKKFVIPDPEVTKFSILPEDEFVIIASDGLWDVIKPEEMINIVHETCKTQGRKYVCQVLCDEALRKDTKDNITVVVLFFNRNKI